MFCQSSYRLCHAVENTCVSRTFICVKNIHKKNIQTGNFAKECQLKQAKPRQTMATLINFLKTNSKKRKAHFLSFKLTSRAIVRQHREVARLRNCTTPRGVDFTTKSLSNLVRFALTQVLIKHVRRSVEPGCCSCVVLSSFPRCRT